MPDKHRNSLIDGLTDYATGPYVLANFYIESFFLFPLLLFTAQRYASSVYAMTMCPVSVHICHKSEFYRIG